jgi:hypothetical protein
MTKKTAEVIPFDAAALAEWRDRLDAARGEAVEKIIAFAAECHSFKHDCERKRGGSVYTEKMAEWYGLDYNTASRWAIVGANRGKFGDVSPKLPPSMETIYLLCEVPDNVIREKVTKATTNREARELKRKHAKPKPYSELAVAIEEGALHARTGGADAARLRQRVLEIDPTLELKNPAHEARLRDVCRVLVAKRGREQVEEMLKAERESVPEPRRSAFDNAVNRAIKLWIARAQVELEQRVEVRVNKELAEQRGILSKFEDEAREKDARLDAALASVDRFMTEDEFRLILNCLHPDRAPEDRRERFNRAFQVFKRLEAGINPNLPISVLRERGWGRR